MNENFSIVMQGPFDDHLFRQTKHIDHYSNYVRQIIVSCYNECDTRRLEEYVAARNDDKVIVDKAERPNFHCNPGNMYLQASSTLRGLKRVSTEFAIKLRANEFYSQIDKVITAVEELPDKLVACNIFTVAVRHEQWKVSDHFFAARTKSLIFSCQNVLDWCHHYNYPADRNVHLNIDEVQGHGQSENVFFLSFLKSKGYNIKQIARLPNKEIYQIMKDNLVIIDVNELSPFIWSCHVGGGSLQYFDFLVSGDYCVRDINHLGEEL